MFSEVIEEEARIQRKKSNKFASDLAKLDVYKKELEDDNIPVWARKDMIEYFIQVNNLDL